MALVVKWLRKTEKYAQTPVIVISTDASAVDRERAMAAGASAFLGKPFSAEDLLQAIENARKERES